jgi:hypothetical protein
MKDIRNAYRILYGILEMKRPLGRLKHAWEDNIKLDLKERGCEGLDWIIIAQAKDSGGLL